MLNYWWVTRPKRKLNSIPEVLATFADLSLNQEWEGQRTSHLAYEDALEKAMKEIGYSLIHRSIETLPNGKALVRMDFSVEKVYTHDLLITYFN